MSEWNAIDLHMHTVPGFTIDKSRDEVIFSYSIFHFIIVIVHIFSLLFCDIFVELTKSTYAEQKKFEYY